ncbi:MAG TPA: SDR family oxidoreductase [Devosia sp.]|nr:SDR family oxidoreductase [Devosia sp.]
MHWASEVYSGKSVVVIGGTSGIGLGVARALAEAGASVRATGATDAEVAVAPASANISFSILDVRDNESILAFAATSGPIVALVNCAGINLRADEFDMAAFERVLDVNLTGAMRLATAFRTPLKGGAMLNLGSMFSTFGAAYAPAYTASKTGLVGLTRSLANAFAKDPVRVNALAPGWIETPMTEAPRANPSRNAEILSRIPIGRWGMPADVAHAALFLCSPLAAYITGVTLPVDGGYLVA